MGIRTMGFESDKIPVSKFYKNLCDLKKKSNFSNNTKYNITDTNLVFGLNDRLTTPMIQNAKISFENPFINKKKKTLPQYYKGASRRSEVGCVEQIATCNVSLLDFFFGLFSDPLPNLSKYYASSNYLILDDCTNNNNDFMM